MQRTRLWRRQSSTLAKRFAQRRSEVVVTGHHHYSGIVTPTRPFPAVAVRQFAAAASNAPPQPRASGRSTAATSRPIRPASAASRTRVPKFSPINSNIAHHDNSQQQTVSYAPRQKLKQMMSPQREALATARELLLQTRSFGPRQFEAAARVLETWKTSLASSTMALDLLSRLMQETSSNPQEYRHLVEPRQYNPILQQFLKLQPKRHVPWQRVWSWITTHAAQNADHFDYNAQTAGIVLQLQLSQDTKQLGARVAAENANQLVDELEQLAKNKPHRAPNVDEYRRLLRAWADCDAEPEMDAVMERLRRSNVAPNAALYYIWLRYWVSHGAIDKMEACVNRLVAQQQQHDMFDLHCWAQVVYGYSQGQKLGPAAQALEYMYDNNRDNNPKDSSNKQLNVFGESVHHVVMACRRAVDNKLLPREVQQRFVQTTRAVVDRYARPEIITSKTLLGA